MKNVIDCCWRAGKVGIVIVDTSQGLKGYIGCGEGENEEVDKEYIVNWGARLSREEIAPFFPDQLEEFDKTGWV